MTPCWVAATASSWRLRPEVRNGLVERGGAWRGVTGQKCHSGLRVGFLLDIGVVTAVLVEGPSTRMAADVRPSGAPTVGRQRLWAE